MKVMNNYFVSVGKRISKVFKHCTPTFSELSKSCLQFHLAPVSADFVSQAISKLKPNKAVGLDKISARLLKDGCHVISPPLCQF